MFSFILFIQCLLLSCFRTFIFCVYIYFVYVCVCERCVQTYVFIYFGIRNFRICQNLMRNVYISISIHFPFLQTLDGFRCVENQGFPLYVYDVRTMYVVHTNEKNDENPGENMFIILIQRYRRWWHT